MLAEPIFQFSEDLQSTNSKISGGSQTSNTVKNFGGSCSLDACNKYTKQNDRIIPPLRTSLKRPSKLELKINLNEQQSASISSSSSTSSQLVYTQQQQQSSYHLNHHDKNNNFYSQNNSTTNSINILKGSNNLVLKETSNIANTTTSGLASQELPPASNQVGNNSNANGNVASTRPVANKKKKRRFAADMQSTHFSDIYSLTGEVLGQGAYGKVWTCRNIYTSQEYAVKIIDKYRHPNRERVFKEIEIYLHCRDCANILKIIEFFEEEEKFYVVFEKMEGGPLLNHIEKRGYLTEREASLIVKDIATALNFLHSKGMAHRDLKPENILCQYRDSVIPVKICDFDLGSSIKINSQSATPVTTPVLCSPVGSAEYLAPEVVEAFINDMSYDKRCDLWSLGVIVYIMLSGKCPFTGKCGSDCGWDRGQECPDCQQFLFERIQEGVYDFPPEDWDRVSEDAKDLIRHLLEHDVTMRYSAADVLRHSWITGQVPQTQLCTPTLLKRNNSVRDIDKYADEALAINRMVEQTFNNSIHGCLSRSSSFYLEKQGQQLDESLSTKLDHPTEDPAYKQLDFAATPTASPDSDSNYSNTTSFFACKLRENLTSNSGAKFLVGDVNEDEDQFKDLNEKDITNMPSNILSASAPIEMKPSKNNNNNNVEINNDDETGLDDGSYLSSTLKENNSLMAYISSSSSSSSSSRSNENEANSGSNSSSSGSDSCNLNDQMSTTKQMSTTSKNNKRNNRRRRHNKKNQLKIEQEKQPQQLKQQQQQQQSKQKSESEQLSPTVTLKSSASSPSLISNTKTQMSYSDVVQNLVSKDAKLKQLQSNANSSSDNDLNKKEIISNSNEVFESDETLKKPIETSNCKFKTDQTIYMKSDQSDYNQSNNNLNKSQQTRPKDVNNYYCAYDDQENNDLEFYLDDDLEACQTNNYYIHSSNNSLNKNLNFPNDFEFEFDTNDEDSSTDYFLASSVDTVINAPFLRAAMMSAAQAVKVKSVSNNNLNAYSSVGTPSATSSSLSAGHFYLLERLNDNKAAKKQSVDLDEADFSKINLTRDILASDSNLKNVLIPSTNDNDLGESAEKTSNEKISFSKPIQLINSLVNVAKSSAGAIFMVNFGTTLSNKNCKNINNNPSSNNNKSSEMTQITPEQMASNPPQGKMLEQKLNGFIQQDSSLSNETEKTFNEDFILDKQKHNNKFRNQKSNFDNNKKLKQTTKSLSAHSALNSYQSTKMDYVNNNNFKDSKLISINNSNDNGNNTYNNNNSNNKRGKNNKSNKFYKYQHQQQQYQQYQHQSTTSSSAPNSTKNSTVLNNSDHSSNYRNNNMKQKFKLNNNSISNNNNKTK